MIDLLADGVVPFSAALMLMFFIGLLEIASVLGGFSIGTLVDNLLPDIDTEFEVEHPGHMGPLAHLFSWLSIGRVPSLVLIVLFLSCFGIGGYLVQLAWSQAFGVMLDAGIASIPAAVLGVLGMSRIGALVARLVPKDQSNVASRKDLFGAVATVVRAGSPGIPAEAKGRDLNGRAHYFLIEDDHGAILERGDDIVVLRLKEKTSVYQGAKVSPKDM